MNHDVYELAIIGAGPAGLEAAITASKAGVKTVIIDSYPQAGGQYYKPAPAAFTMPHPGKTEAEGEALARQLAALPATRIFNTQVWGIFEDENLFEDEKEPGWLVTLYGPGAPKEIHARRLILANGAFDMPVAFPGWTLPGVITCGAALILTKTQRVAPGQRVLVTGTGPLLLSAAAHILDAGVEVVAVCETARLFPEGLAYIPTMLHQWQRLKEGAQYFSTLALHGTPFKTGWSILEAHGKDHVEEAVITKVDEHGTPVLGAPVPGAQQTLKVDTVVCGYGLTPNIELTGMLGCKMEYQPQKGGWIPVRDAWMQTSLPGVYAAGDSAGICGAENARLEGRVAGAAVAQQTGHLSERQAAEIVAQLATDLAHQRDFGRMLGELYPLKPGLTALAHDDTILCRCEEITKAEILAAIAEGCDSVTWVKRVTRSGMGECQGRTCNRLVAQLLTAHGQDLKHMAPDTPRPPLRPVPLEVLEGLPE